jgi:hypothetical protein
VVGFLGGDVVRYFVTETGKEAESIPAPARLQVLRVKARINGVFLARRGHARADQGNDG